MVTNVLVSKPYSFVVSAVLFTSIFAPLCPADVHPNEALSARLAGHSPASGTLVGAGFSFSQGPDNVVGSVTASSAVGVGNADLSNDFGVTPGDFGVTDFQADTVLTLPIVRRVGFDTGLFIQHAGTGEAVSVSGTGGGVARFLVQDPTRAPGQTIGMQAVFAADALIDMPASRDSDRFSVSLSTIAEGDAPLLISTGIWSGSFGSDSVAGVLDDSNIVLSANDVGGTRTRSIAGDNVLSTFAVPNFSAVDVSFTVSVRISSSTGSVSPEAITYTGLETFSVSFTPAPGFDAAALHLVPLPGALTLFGSALLGVVAARHRNVRDPGT